MRNINIISIVLLLFAVSCSDTNSKRTPNVLFILVDDLGVKDLSCTGSKFYETPNVDKIAQSGMMFTQGYASCRVCSPSRASIMLGKAPARHDVTNFLAEKAGIEWRKKGRNTKLLPPEYTLELPEKDVSLAEAMKEAGYITFFAGKWHLGEEGSLPDDHGFDFNAGGWRVGMPIGGYYAPYDNPNLQWKEKGESLTMRLAEETANFIKANKEKPFFAYLSFYAVHSPIQTTPKKWEKYRQKAHKTGLAESGYIFDRTLPVRQVQDNPIYGGLVETMDDAVGMVLKALEDSGVDDNTIVIFTSDNGGVSSGDDFSTSNLPFRGGKGRQWEGGIREPFFIKVPWHVKKGVKCDIPVIHTDFYPTILDFLGLDLKPEQHVDGVSLKPLFEGKTIPKRELYWHYPHYGNQGGEPSSIIRDGDWKLIHYYEDGRDELYNIETDIGEQNNVIEENKDLALKLRTKLDKWLRETGAKFPDPDPEYDVEKAERQLYNMRTKEPEGLERQRLQILRADWQPNDNWWDSKVMND